MPRRNRSPRPRSPRRPTLGWTLYVAPAVARRPTTCIVLDSSITSYLTGEYDPRTPTSSVTLPTRIGYPAPAANVGVIGTVRSPARNLATPPATRADRTRGPVGSAVAVTPVSSSSPPV